MTEPFCPQPDCQLAVSGRCLEGFDPPESCPHQSEGRRATGEVTAFVDRDLVDLPSGEALTDAQASQVTASSPTKLIVIAGPYGSGKTTILTSLFEAFQEAPFANYTFRGSRTLVGFERRCHLGRKESGQETAETSHTSVREGVVFLHLDLSFREGGAPTHENLLLSDISGELFKRVRDVSDAVDQIGSLRRADHLCIVIDGEKIVNRETRQVARNDSRSILRSIVESGVLSDSCIIDLVMTKWDVVVAAMQAEEGADVQSYLDDTIKAVKASAPGRLFYIFEVAARPPIDAKVPFAHGLPTLLRSWMDREIEKTAKATIFLPANPVREVNRFTGSVVNRLGLEESYDVAQF